MKRHDTTPLALLMLVASAMIAQAQTAPPRLTLHQRMELSQACGPDIRKVCGDVSPGDGRIAACVQKHESALSQGCKATLAQILPGIAK